MRCGIIAKKLGMSRVFDDKGRHIPVTVLHMEPCRVLGQKTDKKDGYNAVQIGSGERKDKHTSKAMKGHFAKIKAEPARYIREFRVTPEGLIGVGQNLSVNHFVPGQSVDVAGRSIGKGYAGVMKRYNFSGQRATHGVSLSHRAAGSTGQCQDPGRVFKGKKMAGRMGHRRASIQNLEVITIDAIQSLIFVKGGIPGAKGSWVELRDACKKPLPDDATYPTVGAQSQPVDGGENEAKKPSDELAPASKGDGQQAKPADSKKGNDVDKDKAGKDNGGDGVKFAGDDVGDKS